MAEESRDERSPPEHYPQLGLQMTPMNLSVQESTDDSLLNKMSTFENPRKVFLARLLSDEKIRKMYFACINGDVEAVDALIKSGINLNQATNCTEGYSFLHIAVLHSHYDVVKLLLNNGADPEMVEFCQYTTPLMMSASNGTKEIAELLLNHSAKIATVDEANETALHKAVRNAHLDMIEFLIQKGAKIERYPLLHIAAESDCAAVMRLLLKHGARPDFGWDDEYGMNPLEYTENFGQTFSLRVLSNCKQEKLNRMLWDSIDLDDSHLVERLIDLGADPNWKNPSVTSFTPLFVAVLHNSTNIVNTLLLKGADPNQGFPLLLAVKSASVELVKLLLKHKASIDCQDGKGQTVLHIAVKRCYVEMLEYLLQSGANVNAQDKAGNTALHIAVKKSHSLISTLLKYSASTEIKNNEGKTAVDEASILAVAQLSSEECEKEELAKFLKLHEEQMKLLMNESDEDSES